MPAQGKEVDARGTAALESEGIVRVTVVHLRCLQEQATAYNDVDLIVRPRPALQPPEQGGEDLLGPTHGKGRNKYGPVPLEGPQEPIREMLRTYKERRDAVIEILRDKDLYLYNPGGAFYVLINIAGTGVNSNDFALKLLEEKKVAVAPGETFGKRTDSFVRICFAADTDTLIEGVIILCDRINEMRS